MKTEISVQKQFGKHFAIIMKKMFGIAKVRYENFDFKHPTWYMKHSWNEKQEESFKSWAVEYMIKNVEARNELMPCPRKTRKAIKPCVDFFIFQWGWKRNDW